MRRTLFAASLLFLLVLAIAWERAGAAGTGASTPKSTEILRSDPRGAERLESRRLMLRQWGLDADEYARYETLMSGVRGAFSQPNISPLEVLGIHARTPEERRRYADRLVRVLYQDTERVLAFEREVQAAWRRLGRPMFEPDPDALAPMRPGPGLARALGGRRLAVFVASSGCPACEAQVRVLAAQDGLPGLDVYVVDTNDAGAIQRFARGAGIEPDDVSSKRITLNRGVGLFALWGGDRRQLPALFVRVEDRLLPLDLASPSQPGGKR